MTDSVLLLVFAILLFGLGLFVIFELMEAQAQSRAMDEAERKWWAERAKARGLMPTGDDSSLIDDFNSTLPEQREHDGGPKAA